LVNFLKLFNIASNVCSIGKVLPAECNDAELLLIIVCENA